jgi:RNA polymerase sigma factor (sigma-70 family)
MHEQRECSVGSTPPSLLQRARDQDAAAWHLLVEWASDAVLACCRQAELQDADRDEVFQEVFRRAWQHLGTFERRTSFRKWVYSIARTQVIDLFRARKRHDDLLARFIDHHPPAAEAADPASDVSDANEIGQAIQIWLRQTKHLHHGDTGFRAFYRTAVDGLTSPEAGAELGISEVAVRQHKFRWLKRMRQEFAAAFGDVLPADATKRPHWPV